MSNGNLHSPEIINQHEKLVEALLSGKPLQEAALKAGYSPRTNVYSTILPRIPDRLASYLKKYPEARKNLALLRLPQLANIEEKILNKAEQDEEYALRASKTLEREYRLAGLLQDDKAQVSQTINIDKLAILMQQPDMLDNTSQDNTVESNSSTDSTGNEGV